MSEYTKHGNGLCVQISDHASALRQRDERIAELEAENAELVRKHNEQFKAAAQLAEGVVKLNAENARLSACEWRPITPDDLPKVGDEVGCWDSSDGSYWHHRSVDGQSEQLGDDLVPIADMTLEDWTELEFTHFRPIKPPQQGAKCPA